MSGIDELISIGIEDPEYYAELLSVTTRDVNGRLLSNEHSCSDIPSIQGVDLPPAQRLKTLLDVVADISLCQRGNVSATMACIKPYNDTVETQIYIAFNHENDEAAVSCPEHLQSIFEMLHQVRYRPPATNDSPRVMGKELEDELVKICGAILNYSYDIFNYRVNKRKHKLSQIREYIEQGSAHFLSQRHSTLVEFLEHVDAIINIVADSQATKQLPDVDIRMLLNIYSYWMNHNFLTDDPLANNKPSTLLDEVDAWLAEGALSDTCDFTLIGIHIHCLEHDIGFQLRRWATKIMSFVISANRLIMLTQSRRLRHILDGKFTVQVLSSPITTPYHCDLSSETMRIAVDTALAEAKYDPRDLDEDRTWFMEMLQQRHLVSDVVHDNPTIHAELVLIIAKAEGEINNVEPYIGVSKLSCIMCSHFICAFNMVMKQKIATKGFHGKAYTGWFWPRLPSLDEELRRAFLNLIRQQIRSDVEQYAEARRLSDSSVGSGFPKLDLGQTKDTISEMIEARTRRVTEVDF